MKSPLLTLVLAAAVGLAACATDDFGDIGSGLPTDVSQDSLLVDGPDLEVIEIGVVVPDTVQAFADRSRLFLGNRDRDGLRATPVMRFDFDEARLREELLDALLEFAASDEQIAAAEAIADTLPFTAEFVARTELEIVALDREVTRDVTLDQDAKKLIRTVRVRETSRAITGDDVAVTAASELHGDELTTFSTTQSQENIDVPLPVDRVLAWIGTGAHTGLLIEDLEPGDLQYTASGDTLNPNESNVISLAADGFPDDTDGSTREPEVILEVDAPSPFDTETIVIAAPVTIDFTVIEQDEPPMDAPVLASHRVRRSWLLLDLGAEVLPSNATINQAVLTLHPIDLYTVGTPESAEATGSLDVECFEATRSEAERADPGRTNANEGISALNFVARSGFSPLRGDTLRVDVTRFVQRAVNEVVDPSGTGLLLLFASELTDFDQGVFHGPSAADSLQPRVTVTFTPPADSWR